MTLICEGFYDVIYIMKRKYLQRIKLNDHLVEMLRIEKNAMEQSIAKFK